MRGARSRIALVASIAVVAVLAASLLHGANEGRSESASDLLQLVRDIPDVQGTLRLVAFGDETQAVTEGPRLRSTYVNGRGYVGMEDNDIRGFLDGRFKWGWNQPGQMHVRVGRRGSGARYGEYEIFRVLQRWSGIRLVPGATVVAARLTIQIEVGHAAPLRVLLYAVRPDWNPGAGGTRRDNVSPPKTGEVWWNDIGFDSASWGLPGAGYASLVDPAADVSAIPLAAAAYAPGDSLLVFSGPMLADYISSELERDSALRFLLKVADLQEDIPGAELTLYSGSQADDKNPGRRPRLEIEWVKPAPRPPSDQRVRLEYGRTLLLPAVRLQGARWLALSFDPDSGAGRPLIEIRGGREHRSDPWRPYEGPMRTSWEWAEVRLRAVENPVELGDAFVSGFTNTWIRSAPPEQQQVPWTFISPTGVKHVALAHYAGASRWTISFVPDELGPWRYFWTESFTEFPYRSPEGRFDVVGGDTDNIERQLSALAQRARTSELAEDESLRERLMIQFARLERAALQSLTPTTFRGPDGERLRRGLDRVRTALGGEPVPEVLPLRPDPGPEWSHPAGP